MIIMHVMIVFQSLYKFIHVLSILVDPLICYDYKFTIMLYIEWL
jgi:hypothetical protein